ncbi:hypothetical protein [Lysinibacillus fusiformis]|uniref:hypothetical protein n=1 Tax=Lysinibacillus fusiformis TaxID=28031 RepID=UPI0021C05D5E|nr:hypothetical protein [Lysinibacillus fusiformis]UXJ71404.1 hypothetical protein N5069_23565 [Lysinibacillus fusiformis]
MKKVIMLCCLFLLVFPSFAYAEEGKENSCKSKELLSDERRLQIKEFQDKDSTVQESYTIDIFEGFWNIVGINSVSSLVFGNPYCLWTEDNSPLVYGIFPEYYKDNIIDPMFNFFTSLFVGLLTLAMMIFSAKRMINPFNKNQFVDEFLQYFMAAALITLFWGAIEYVFLINETIVATFREFLLSQGIDLGGVAIFASQDDFNFTDIVIIFAEWILMVFLNAIYLLRLFLITILMGMGGLAIISLLFPESRHIFTLWIQDTVGSIFMQSIHALYCTFILLIFSTVSGEFSVFFKLFCLILFIPLTNFLQGIFKLSSGGVLTGIGLNGVNSIAAAVSFGKSMKSLNHKTPNMGQLNETKISALAKGTNSKPWQKTTNLLAKTGMYAGGAAGLVLGPSGAIIGGTIASKMLPATLQAPRNIAGGLKGLKDTFGAAKSKGMPNVMSNIQDKRNFYGNVGESLGTMVGQGKMGRQIGNFASGVSNKRILNSSELGGLSGLSIRDLASRYPESEFIFKQTNEGSGLYKVNSDGEDSLISPIGAADTSLANGETRCIDYKSGGSGIEFDSSKGTYNHSERTSPLDRTSDAYIQNSYGTRFADPTFNAKRMNPDDYFKENLNNSVPKPDEHRHPGFV